MKLEPNMYVRTKAGMIAKIVSKEDVSGSLHREEIVFILDNGNRLALHSRKVVKASHNIMDLIEVGDYVNGSLVEKVGKDRVFTNVYYEDGYYNSFIGADEDWESCYVSDYRQEIIYDYEIKSIVTKEQFESMSYKVD